MTERDLLDQILDVLNAKYLHWVYVLAKSLHNTQLSKGGVV